MWNVKQDEEKLNTDIIIRNGLGLQDIKIFKLKSD